MLRRIAFHAGLWAGLIILITITVWFAHMADNEFATIVSKEEVVFPSGGKFFVLIEHARLSYYKEAAQTSFIGTLMYGAFLLYYYARMIAEKHHVHAIS